MRNFVTIFYRWSVQREDQCVPDVSVAFARSQIFLSVLDLMDTNLFLNWTEKITKLEEFESNSKH